MEGNEYGYKSGTLNVPAIVGFGKAAELADKKNEDNQHAKKLRDLLISGINN